MKVREKQKQNRKGELWNQIIIRCSCRWRVYKQKSKTTVNSLKMKSSRGRKRSTVCNFAGLDSDARIAGKSDSSFERACMFREVCRMFLCLQRIMC